MVVDMMLRIKMMIMTKMILDGMMKRMRVMVIGWVVLRVMVGMMIRVWML